MKKLLLISLLFVSFTYAQETADILLNHTWHLVSFDNECFGINPGENSEFDINNISLTFTENDGVINYHSEMCTTLDGTMSFTDEMIEFSNQSLGENRCEQYFNYYYEQGYACALSATYSYTLSQNDDNSWTLNMSNLIFMNAIFTTQSLSSQEYKETQIRIYPNPTNDILILENPESTWENAQILTMDGKIVLEREVLVNRLQISIGHLLSGSYILRLRDKNGKYFSKKILKK